MSYRVQILHGSSYGQSKQIPEIPEMPEISEISEILEISDISDISDISEYIRIYQNILKHIKISTENKANSAQLELELGLSLAQLSPSLFGYILTYSDKF